MPAVRVEERALSDSRFSVLGNLLGNTRHDAMGRMLLVWSYCTDKNSHYISDSMLVAIFEKKNACELLIEADLVVREGDLIRVRGTEGRIEWLDKLRENASKGGRATARKVARPVAPQTPTTEQVAPQQTAHHLVQQTAHHLLKQTLSPLTLTTTLSIKDSDQERASNVAARHKSAASPHSAPAKTKEGKEERVFLEQVLGPTTSPLPQKPPEIGGSAQNAQNDLQPEETPVLSILPGGRRPSAAVELDGPCRGFGGSESDSIATYLLEAIRSHHPNYRCTAKNMVGWSRDIDLAIRRDGRTPDELRRAIDFAHRSKDPFWRGNLLSGAKLRQKFDQLVIQCKSRRKQEGLSASDLMDMARQCEELEKQGIMNPLTGGYVTGPRF